MERLGEVLAALIDDHGKRPRNFGDLEDATHSAEGVNAATGDFFRVMIRLGPTVPSSVEDRTLLNGESNRVESVRFTGRGSALAIASASVMTMTLQSLTEQEAIQKIEETLEWISVRKSLPKELPDNEWSRLLEIREIPHRISCASLPWKTALRAFDAPPRESD